MTQRLKIVHVSNSWLTITGMNDLQQNEPKERSVNLAWLSLVVPVTSLKSFQNVAVFAWSGHSNHSSAFHCFYNHHIPSTPPPALTWPRPLGQGRTAAVKHQLAVSAHLWTVCQSPRRIGAWRSRWWSPAPGRWRSQPAGSLRHKQTETINFLLPLMGEI